MQDEKRCARQDSGSDDEREQYERHPRREICPGGLASPQMPAAAEHVIINGDPGDPRTDTAMDPGLWCDVTKAPYLGCARASLDRHGRG